MPESKKMRGELFVITEEGIKLGTGLSGLLSPRAAAGRGGLGREKITEIGSIFFPHRLVDGFRTVPVASGGVETAVQTHLGVFPAGRTSGGAVDLKIVGKAVATMKASGHGPMIHFSLDMCNKILNPYTMFQKKNCSVEGCLHSALSFESVCVNHLSDLDAYKEKLRRFFQENKFIKDISLPGISLEGWDLSDKDFTVCDLSEVNLKGVNFSGTTFRMTFFPFSRFEDCRFTESAIRYNVFAGSRMENCDFTGSELLHCNFNGLQGRNSVFNESDLYFSCFISAQLEDVSFRDCNLKRVNFSMSRRKGVDFKYSNYEEAIFKEENRQ